MPFLKTYLFWQYLRFLTKATNQHGVHSPFVYKLVTECFYDGSKKKEYALLKLHRRALLSNKNMLHVTDFGAGSRVFKSDSRKIAHIAKQAGISFSRAKLLFRVTRYFKPENSLEIGTSLGLGTVAIATGNPNGKVTTLEGCAETLSVAQTNIHQFGIGNVEYIQTEFSEYLSKLPEHQIFDLVYIDGNHQKKATLNYFNWLLTTKHNDSVWIFDDIYWSKEMTEAWETIKAHPKVSVTIDMFYWGMVFFRKEQVKQNFFIRL